MDVATLKLDDVSPSCAYATLALQWENSHCLACEAVHHLYKLACYVKTR